MDLYCLNYNNYYNRIIKKEETIDGYLPYLLDRVMTNIAFNPSDGVTTNQILNWNDVSVPDYIVVASGNEIVSRWFVIEMSRTRNGQYSLVLKRDLIVDHYQPIINAPCFIEKATLNQDDPMIFNSEDMTFNQIKTSETLLKDKSESPWIVGYYAKDFVDPNDSNSSLTASDIELNIEADIKLNTNINQWEYYNYIQTKNNYYSAETKGVFIKYIQSITVDGYSNLSYPRPDKDFIKKDGTIDVFLQSTSGTSLISQASTLSEMFERTRLFRSNLNFSIIDENLSEYSTKEITISEEFVQNLLDLNNKIISYTDENQNTVYKRIEAILSRDGKYEQVIPGTNTFNELNNNLNNLINQNYYSGTANDKTFEIEVTYKKVFMTLKDITSVKCSTKIKNSSNRYNVNDQPYSMFAIPFGSVNVKNTGASGWNNFTTEPEISLKTAYSLIEKYSGSGTIYDVQLLPYCPIQNVITNNAEIDLNNDGRLFSLIVGSDNKNYGIILNCNSNTFSFNIDYEINVDNKKITNETETYRLCSPNFNGNFEFNPAKNNGVKYFNVDCEYKPFSPYIHLNPNFNGLYGKDFNDARGLICGGDFSLTQISDNWNTYQIQNKNYKEIFNRQIQNMEINNSIQKEKEIWGAVAGSVQGTVSGAVAGGMIGGPWGAVAGGIVGAGSSIAGGIRDVQLNQRLRNEALDYTKDQFGYQLGNIKALPDNLTQVSSYNPNNKIFPILEYYTCTDIEKQALENKLKYNGMTVMRIGTIAEFIRTERTYIKGKLIRLEGISDDFHIVNEISNEIFKGVFI